MLLLLLLLSLSFTLPAASITYDAGGQTFSYSGKYLYVNSTGDFHLELPYLEAGDLDKDEALTRLYFPWEDSISLSGVKLGDEKVKLYFIYDPVISAGYSFSFFNITSSLAYIEGGESEEAVGINHRARGGYTALLYSLSYSARYLSLNLNGSFAETLNPNFLIALELKYKTLSLSWTEGTSLALTYDKEEKRREIEFRIKDENLRYSAVMTWGGDPVIAGSYRPHEGSERLEFIWGSFKLGSRHKCEFSSEGEYSYSSRYYVSLFGFMAGIYNDLTPFLSYSKGAFRVYWTKSSFSVSLSYKWNKVSFYLRFKSDGALTMKTTLFL